MREQPIQIRTGGLEDLANIAKLLTHSFYPDDRLWNWVMPLLQFWTYQDLQSRFHTPALRYTWLVGTEPLNGNQAPPLVASVEIGLRLLGSIPTGPVPYISNLAVDSSYRQRGLGRQLLLACEPIVKAWGCQEIYLHALSNNKPALKLYESVGYRMRMDDSHVLSMLLKQPQRFLLRKCF